MATRFMLFPDPRAATLLIACGAALASCATLRPGRVDDNARNLEAVSPTEPAFAALPPPVPVTRNARPVASTGTCAPVYANGLHGSCINNTPCRGFGIQDEAGRPVCACYATPGGCRPSERCDAIRKACVPETTLDWGLPPDD